MSYATTKEQCAKLIHGVCRGCGEKLEPIETEDNAGNPTFWSGCFACSRFDNGVDRRVWETARRMFEGGYRHYSHLHLVPEDTEGDRAYKTLEQVRGTCNVVIDVLAAYALTAPAGDPQ